MTFRLRGCFYTFVCFPLSLKVDELYRINIWVINRCGHGYFDSQPVHVVEDVVGVNPQLGDVVVDHRDALILVVQHRDREQLRLKELWQRCHTVQL